MWERITSFGVDFTKSYIAEYMLQEKHNVGTLKQEQLYNIK